MKKFMTMIFMCMVQVLPTANSQVNTNMGSTCIAQLEAHYDTCTVVGGWQAGCFKLANCKITDDDILTLIEKMRAFPKAPTIIDLSHNKLTSEGVKRLTKGIEQLPNYYLAEFDISHNKVGNEGAIALAKSRSTMLTRLIANHNQIGDAGASEIFKMFYLEVLDLSYNQFGSGGIPKDNYQHKLNNVDVSGNQLKSGDIKHIVHAMQGDGNWRNQLLYLNDMSLGDEGALEISKLFSETVAHYLRIELANNNITDIGAAYLAKIGFYEAGALLLNLNNNKVAKKGVLELIKNHHIYELDLANDGVDDETAILIARTFRANGLGSLDLSGNKLTFAGIVKMLQYLNTQELALNDIELGDEIVPYILNMIKEGIKLSSLSLRNTNLHDASARTLGRVDWAYLDISHNYISDKALSIFDNRSGYIIRYPQNK